LRWPFDFIDELKVTALLVVNMLVGRFVLSPDGQTFALGENTVYWWGSSPV
jgi:hypothetical protein